MAHHHHIWALLPTADVIFVLMDLNAKSHHSYLKFKKTCKLNRLTMLYLLKFVPLLVC